MRLQIEFICWILPVRRATPLVEKCARIRVTLFKISAVGTCGSSIAQRVTPNLAHGSTLNSIANPKSLMNVNDPSPENRILSLDSQLDFGRFG